VIDGLDNETVAVGDRLVIGEIILQATAPRMPCATFAAKMDDAHFVERYRKAERPGFYCRVISGGKVSAGSGVDFQACEGVRITMPAMMRDYGKTISGDKLAAYLSAPTTTSSTPHWHLARSNSDHEAFHEPGTSIT
jgi:MOSC domain-containing protein YiiM